MAKINTPSKSLRLASPQVEPAAPVVGTVAEPVVETQQVIRVRNVHGPMHHLKLDRRIDGITEFDAIDGWLQSQLDAGKLELC